MKSRKHSHKHVKRHLSFEDAVIKRSAKVKQHPRPQEVHHDTTAQDVADDDVAPIPQSRFGDLGGPVG